MTDPTRFILPSRWYLACVTLLAFRSGCSGDLEDVQRERELASQAGAAGLQAFRHSAWTQQEREQATQASPDWKLQEDAVRVATRRHAEASDLRRKKSREAQAQMSSQRDPEVA